MGRARILGYAVLVPYLVLGATTYAVAHAAYEDSDPGDGETVSSPPSRVVVDFTERLTDGSYLAVTDPCGENVDNGDSLVAADRLTISMSADRAGTYVVRFDVVSAIDGHPTDGQFTFISAGGAQCAAPADDGGGTDEDDPRSESSGNRREPTADTRSTNTGAVAPKGDNQEGTRSQVAATRDERAQRARSEPDLAAPSTEPEPEEAPQQPIWDGIPASGFAIGLTLAALIGAAGGRIYANILGPRA